MNNKSISAPFVLGAFICIGLVLLGYLISSSVIRIKALDRTIEVKGLSEREVLANIAIWPIKFKEAGNDLNNLFSSIQRKNTIIAEFLKKHGFKEKDISISAPAILDRQAQENTESDKSKYRYSGTSTVSVYTENVDSVRNTMQELVDLGKLGIAISGETYESKTLFLFTKLNDIKPGMIEEATKNAREVAEKFAQDSKSKLGKIKSASQGQFSIEDRDNNTPYIKKVRVVSTVQYYLTD
jgi:hypothetical protein